MATKKATARKASTRTRRAGGGETGALPPVVYAQASPRSVGGVSLFDATRVTADTVDAFTSDAAVIRAAVDRLNQAGFQVLQVSPTTINIAGPPALYQRAFRTRLQTVEREVIKPGARRDTATFVDSPDTTAPGLIDTSGTPFADVLEGVAIEEPVYWMADAHAPNPAYWYLDVPGDVSLALNADAAHRASPGLTGRDIAALERLLDRSRGLGL